jgi:chromosome segregation ATPase
MGHRFQHTDTCAAAHAALTAERVAAETKRADEDMSHTIKIYHGCIRAVKHLTRTVVEKQRVIDTKYQENYRVGSKRRDIEYHKGVIDRNERSIEEYKREIGEKTSILAATIKTLADVKAAIERFNMTLEVLKGTDPVDEERIATIQKNKQVLKSSITRKATEANAHVADINKLNDCIKQCSESIARNKETVTRMETEMEELLEESKREHEQKVREAGHIVSQTPSAVTFLQEVIMTLAPSDFTIESIEEIELYSVDRHKPARALNTFKRREMLEKFSSSVDPVCQQIVQRYFA